MGRYFPWSLINKCNHRYLDVSYQSVKALLAKGISRPTLFQVLIPGIDRQAQDQLTFLCKTASVPSVAVDTIAVNGHESLGVVREQATLVTYSKPFTITVISDRDYTVYKEMRKWFDTNAKNANPNQRIFGVAAGGSSQRMGYFDTIRRQITLKKLEQNGEQSYFQPFEIEFNNAFITSIGELSLDTEGYDSKMEFNVDFTYETYTIDTQPQDQVEYE